MLEIDEPLILDGSRAFPETQNAFSGPVDSTRARHLVACSWYDTSLSDYEGAFCLIQAGSELEELVGDIVSVKYRGKEIFVYCVGGAELTTDFALFRRAFFALEDLAYDEINAVVQPVRS